MIKKSKTFCVAPWFQTVNQNNLEKRVCCLIETPSDPDSKKLTPLQYLNSEPIIELKKQLSNGEQPNVCSKCWNDEKNDILSLRQMLNSVLTDDRSEKNNWLDSYLKHKQDYTSDFIISADIKVGNTCNHACVMCSPESSSMIYNDWLQRKDSRFVKEYTDKNPNYFEIVKFLGFKNKGYREYVEQIIKDNKHLKYLKIVGGEPFLDSNLLDLLSDLDDKTKQKLKLSFVTNGSVDFSEVLEKIGKFNYIQFTVSLEGIGKVHEFARAGSKWEFVSKNVLNAVNRGVNVTVHHTFQTATILGFEDLLNWCKQHSIRLSCGVVEEPDYLSIKSLPEVIKNDVIELITNTRDVIKNTDHQVNNGGMSYNNLILKLKNVEFDSQLHRKFFEYIDWYQSNKNIPKLETICPQLYKYRNT